MTDEIQDEWAEEFGAWESALKSKFDDIENTPVKILIWGPGEGWERYYAKRIQIRDHLRAINRHNEAVTSEELEQQYPQLKQYNTQDAERVQVETCDLIIILVVKEKKVTGVQTEISIYRQQRGFYDKARLLIPRLTTRERERNQGFLSQGWIDYPREHCLVYNEQQFEDCTRIRNYCAGHATRVRQHLAFRGTL